jgi:N-acetylneuraminic acid mutarotase
MSTDRSNLAAAMLADGRVLVTGGYDRRNETDLASAELYDPATNVWSPVASMSTPRYNHVATMLADGRILVSGGVNVANQGGIPSAEIYDPVSNSWSSTGSMAVSRETDEAGGHRMVLLPATGDILAVGGYNTVNGVLNTAEAYRPSTGMWSETPTLGAMRQGPTATLLADGKVLVVGGFDNSGPVASTELYDPVTNAWSIMGSSVTPRGGHSATALPDGRVLVAGGVDASGALANAELFIRRH